MAGWTVVPTPSDASAWKPVPASSVQSVPGAVPGMQEPSAVSGVMKPDLSYAPTVDSPVNLVKGAWRGIKSLADPNTYAQMGSTLQAAMPRYANVNGVPMPVPNEAVAAQADAAGQQANFAAGHPFLTAGQIAGPMAVTAGLAKGLPVAAGAVGDAAGALRDAAIGDPNVAALKGLRIGPASPKAIATVNAVEGARPYLQGVQSLEDLQARIPQAKAEIWGPYQTTVDAIANKKVFGPEGPTTVGDLETQRLQLSALNRGLKSQNPEAIQVAQQKGLTQAQLLQQEQDVKAALDPHLEAAGIKPADIRRVFGQVAQIGQRVSGKSTLAETPQRFGVGQMANLSLEHPLQAPAQVAQGVRDLVAGRPLWSGSPTDVSIREAFRNAGPKPDLGTPAPQYTQPPLALPAQAGGPMVTPYNVPMTPGERTAALMQYLRQRPQAQLPASAQPIQLPVSTPQIDPNSPLGQYYRLMSLRQGNQ